MVLLSESFLWTEQIRKQAVLLKSLEVYLSIDIECVGVITKVSTQKIDSEVLCTAGIWYICGAMAQRTVKPDLLTYPKC